MDLSKRDLAQAVAAIRKALARPKADDEADRWMPAPCRRITVSPLLDGSWGTCHLDVIDAQPVPGKYGNLPAATTLAYRLYHHPDGGPLVVAAVVWAWEDGALRATVFDDAAPCRQLAGADAHCEALHRR